MRKVFNKIKYFNKIKQKKENNQLAAGEIKFNKAMNSKKMKKISTKIKSIHQFNLHKKKYELKILNLPEEILNLPATLTIRTTSNIYTKVLCKVLEKASLLQQGDPISEALPLSESL